MADFKYLWQLYEKDINRPFNPAVNAQDFNEKTVDIEINEYVFTEEIINNLYKVLNAIRERSVSHNGIWINGYFGSGKSHFLKFLDYCLHPDYSGKALSKLAEAVKEHDPLQNPDSKCDVTIADMNSLISWLNTANVETILFNIGSVANSNTNQQKVFTEVFWHELNRHRGYNAFSLPLAQYLEKALDEKGKFTEFKERLDDEFGWDWDEKAAELANTELDTILEVAKDVAPSLSTDVIRERIVKNEFPLTVESFMKELADYINGKPDNFRLVFFADEISQFIDNRSAMLLQLQQIVSDLHDSCNGKVWITCTAQQDLSEILGDCHISRTTDDYGKIMGRFQVKVSLKGTNTEYITQKRILDKKGSAAIVLQSDYERIHNNITAQLLFPTGYNTFHSKEEYAAYYPFIPYQFTLMMNIFDAFVAQGYVDKEVKGNERSIIKITHSVANATKDQEIGNLISFDQFYNAMFSNSLTAKGQKSIATANNVIATYPGDKELGQKVVNVLFMICNMDEQQRRVFPATVDYITSLLMRNMDENKQKLKNDIEGVLEYLVRNNILRRDTLSDGTTDFYTFFTEEERRVASSISSQYVDNDFMADTLIEFVKSYLAPDNRVPFGSSRFTIGGTVNGKNFLNSNADILVDFVLDSDVDVNQYVFSNVSNRLGFYMADGFNADRNLRNRLTWVCKVNKFLRSPEGQSTDEARAAALNKFRQMAADEYKEIEKILKELFNKATVATFNQTLNIAASTKDKARYQEALTRHLQNVYKYATVVGGSSVPSNETQLKEKILRPAQQNEYAEPNNVLSAPEQLIEDHIRLRGGEVNLRDIVKHFSAAPYGWSQEATIFFVNELVRRNLREYTYNNAENPEKNVIANNILRDSSKFMVRGAKEVSQELINQFLAALRDIVGGAISTAASHPTEIHNWAKTTLSNIERTNSNAINNIGGNASPIAARLIKANNLIAEWQLIRDDEQFFNRIIQDVATAKQIFDDAKQLRDFADAPNRLAGFRDFTDFVNNNRDNWQYLSADYKPEIEMISRITTDDWPVDKMQHYKRIKDNLTRALDEVRQGFRARIEKKLYAEDEQIASYAAENEVPYESVVRAEITRETTSSNISTLKANENSNDWLNREIAEINRKIAQRNQQQQQQSGSGSGTPATPTPVQAPRRVATMRLRTSSFSNIKNAEDVEKYLDKLRQQITSKLANLNSGDELQIL